MILENIFVEDECLPFRKHLKIVDWHNSQMGVLMGLKFSSCKTDRLIPATYSVLHTETERAGPTYKARLTEHF